MSSTKEKSREEVLAEQRQDHSGRDRNKRMFGALLGTLHRFKQDETKLKEKVTDNESFRIPFTTVLFFRKRKGLKLKQN